MPFSQRFRRALAPAAVAWGSSLGLLGLLQAVSPNSAVHDAALSIGARATALAGEAVALAVLCLLAAACVAALPAPEGRRFPRAVRIVLLAVLLLALWGSWGWFWLSGRFLDGPGLQFIVRHFGAVYGYSLRTHPILTAGLPLVCIAVAIVIAEAAPSWFARLPERATRIVERTALGLALVGLVAAAAGSWSRAGAAAVDSPAAMERLREENAWLRCREETVGPLAHLATSIAGRSRRDLFEDQRPTELFQPYAIDRGWLFPDRLVDRLDDGPPAEVSGITRTPIVPLDAYLAGVDRAAVKRWNVVVVLIDSFRRDQLLATGGPREVMPALEALAKEGRAYSDCATTASHTDCAAPSVFSSHYPLRSRWRHVYPENPRYPRVMVYDVLKRLGWRTAMFSSQNEDWAGMDRYYQTGLLDVLLHPNGRGIPTKLLETRDPTTGSLDDSVTITEALRWVGQEPEAPFFLYLNLQNAHLPFRAPPEFPRKFGPASWDFQLDARTFPPEKTAIVKEIYANSLAYVDSQLDRLFRRLKEQGAWDRTVVVISGDHGESFYEHKLPAHANGIYDEVISVPLVVRAPGLEPGRDPRPSILLDVAPGLLHLLGLPPHPGFQGANLFGPPPPPSRSRFVLSQTGWRTHLGLIRSGFKLIRDSDQGTVELYDLKLDPAEQVNLASLRPDLVRDLRARLNLWRWAQIEYYENPERQDREYPPRLPD